LKSRKATTSSIDQTTHQTRHNSTVTTFTLYSSGTLVHLLPVHGEAPDIHRHITYVLVRWQLTDYCRSR